ncbi:endonuclease I [bacterium]|nr:endonuclease I [bacterium]
MNIKRSKARSNAIKHGYRSGLELTVLDSLKDRNCDAKYECLKIEWEELNYRLYTPDFLLPNGILIETKGRFTVEDRKKHLEIQKQHPHLDIRFVFTNSRAKIRKGSKTSYGMWCGKHKFLYADKDVPQEWIKERKKPAKLVPSAFVQFPLKKIKR